MQLFRNWDRHTDATIPLEELSQNLQVWDSLELVDGLPPLKYTWRDPPRHLLSKTYPVWIFLP